MPTNYASEIAKFWQNVVGGAGIERAVRVQRAATAEGPRTIVSVEHWLPHLPFAHRGAARWRITTERHELDPRHFKGSVRKQVRRQLKKKRGRVLFCVDQRRDEVLAVVGFHVDPLASAPIIVTVVGYRIDSDSDITNRSIACAGWLLAYLHVVAQKERRPAELGYEANSQAEVDEVEPIGFRHAGPPAGFRPLGRYYLSVAPQRPPRSG